MNKRLLNCTGEWDYDYINDILFFKVKDREYSYSVELKNLVIDVDSDNFITGFQIMGASGMFNLPKDFIRGIKSWKFEANVEENVVELKLVFELVYRNKLVEKNPILIQSLGRDVPDSRLVCSA